MIVYSLKLKIFSNFQLPNLGAAYKNKKNSREKYDAYLREKLTLFSDSYHIELRQGRKRRRLCDPETQLGNKA
jgi:hypothetical protein